MSSNKVVILQNSIKTTYLFRIETIKLLLDEGFEVIVVAPNDYDAYRIKLNEIGVTTPLFINSNSKLSFVMSIFLMNLLIVKYRLQGARFICHFLVTFFMTFFSLLPFNKRLVVYVEGVGSMLLANKFLLKVAKYLLSFAPLRLFCNKDEKLELGIYTDIVTNGIGVNLNKFESNVVKKDSDVFKLLYVGRLIKDKGVLDAINAHKLLLERGCRVKLTLLGDLYPNNPSSLSKSDVESLKRELGDTIEFCGFKDEIEQEYLSSHILLLPSKREGFPVCVMEATASGIPSVCYDVPGCRDAITPQLNGTLVTPFSVNDFADSIATWLNHGKLRSVHNIIKAKAAKDFDRKKKSQQIVDIISVI
ncbi:glycosyltransferase [Grimontia hollisae]|uniref:glycosyltransferase n=1 Tax=Grimontia hollisae TaxID=673 RepID=UPI0013032F20|nr:glycosyltransferase [Grimontia hollisae]